MKSFIFFPGMLMLIVGIMMPGFLLSLEIPLTLNWLSANTFAYAPDQYGKEYNWNEFYRLDLGIDSLSCHNLSFSLDIRSRANFIDTYLLLERAELDYHAQGIGFGAELKPIGFAKRDQLHPAPIINHGGDAHQFLPARFHGLYLEIPSFYDVKMELGGNMHNLASGKLSVQIPILEDNGLITLTQETRTFDSEWHRPLLIGALQMDYTKGGFAFSAITATAHYPEFDERASRSVPFLHFETSQTLTPQYCVYLQGFYTELLPARSIHKSIEIALGKSLGKLNLSPGITLELINAAHLISPYAVMNWAPIPDQQLGIYYRRVIGDSGSSIHQAGLQAELSFDY